MLDLTHVTFHPYSITVLIVSPLDLAEFDTTHHINAGHFVVLCEYVLFSRHLLI